MSAVPWMTEQQVSSASRKQIHLSCNRWNDSRHIWFECWLENTTLAYAVILFSPPYGFLQTNRTYNSL